MIFRSLSKNRNSGRELQEKVFGAPKTFLFIVQSAFWHICIKRKTLATTAFAKTGG
jgi:hypothetical protein